MRLPRWLLWPLLAAVAIALVLAWPHKPLAVRVESVGRGLVEDVVTSAVAGEVTSAHSTQVRSEVEGVVAAVKARRGATVKRGQLIVSIDPGEFDARLAQARAQEEIAEASLAQAQAQEAAARPSAARVLRLLAHGAATEDAADRARAELLSALAGERLARAHIAEARAELQLAVLARRKADLTAPFAGALQQVYPEVGADLVPGAPAFDLIDEAATRVETSIDEADTARVAVGQEAELSLDAYPGVVFKGTVSLVAPAIAPDPRLGTTRSLPIWVDVAPDPRLRIGMSSTVQIIVAHKSGVLFIPSQLVLGRGVTRSVYRVEAGVARKVSVETGLSNWERTEILSGLSEGDAIVSSLDVPGLTDGVRVVAEVPDAG